MNKSFSPNMLKTFQTCPQKYWFKYVQKISMPQKNSLFEKGKKVHALANYYLQGDDISKLEAALKGDEREAWEKLKNNEYFQKSYVNSEYNLTCKVCDYWVCGRLDALVRDDENYYILDYKTGQIPKNPEFDFQTMVYLLCVSKKFKDPHHTLNTNRKVKFVYIDLKNNKNCVIDYDKDYETLIKQMCDKIIHFQPLEDIEHSKICEFCEYRKICK